MGIKIALNRPPKEAVRILKQRGVPIQSSPEQLTGQAHLHALVLSGGLQREAVQIVRDLSIKALEEGWSEERWRSELKSTAPEQLQSRARTIFRSAVNTAYHAARYDRQIARQSSFPYARYVAVLDRRTRPAHAALHGTILEKSSGALASIYPPNGHGCRCQIEDVSEHRLRRNGWQASTSKQDRQQVTQPNGVKRPVTKVTISPPGRNPKPIPFEPAPGFDHPPTLKQPQRWDDGDTQPLRSTAAEPSLPRATKLEPPKRAPSVTRPPEGAGQAVPTSAARIGERAGKLSREQISAIIKQPDEVWLTPSSDGTFRRHFVKRIPPDQVVILRELHDGRIVPVQSGRSGTLLHRKGGIP